MPDLNPSPEHCSGFTDEEIVRRVLAGELGLFEIVMRRNNRRVYRAVRSIVKSDAEAEDVMQEAYVNAYAHLADFSGRSRLSTWLADVADFVVKSMPAKAPGSLAEQQYWAILAFDLKANGIDLDKKLDATVASTLTILRK